jgi:hypothetical protein
LGSRLLSPLNKEELMEKILMLFFLNATAESWEIKEQIWENPPKEYLPYKIDFDCEKSSSEDLSISPEKPWYFKISCKKTLDL